MRILLPDVALQCQNMRVRVYVFLLALQSTTACCLISRQTLVCLGCHTCHMSCMCMSV